MNDTRTVTQQLVASLAATTCRTQPILNFANGGTLCGKCGRQVPNACERSWLNDEWAKTDDERVGAGSGQRWIDNSGRGEE